MPLPRILRRLAWLSVPLTLTACAGHSPRPDTAKETKVIATPESTPSTPAPHQEPEAAKHAPRVKTAGESDRNLPEYTGIPVCDVYLSTYKACHRAAGIYRPDTIEAHYQAMRHTLLEQSMDPKERKLLPERCASLARSLKNALHGKSCDFPEAGPPEGGSL
ncbi:hypothetical protein [Oleiagrimonas sp. C23AA]|uniref:hypothetical protein n=1 Tax=Oleiagrimonas sp. C23AA TaxID=2719047 RepID=UPI00141D919E|nr:hypothetical protein [Oleiagrimonas sp. C23AA]NII09623.1 hypothetical protein [Oleiagrimonas sp. C23AA]